MGHRFFLTKTKNSVITITPICQSVFCPIKTPIGQCIQGQPTEVMLNAWNIFQNVYGIQGSVSGVKARALMWTLH